ncbi:MSMEG_1061 family FMN-dependent PPOX-type flavoprotein [Actinomadura algeriensis]|uniref:PPOX class probable FMN-dependent enzyme n=1 Tax=Actinomadura algeriensis TaxID=1679523 RepID=A0ABR9JQE7_9ACTN|nr:MSMEG_1061 family FMN-dependent PPOX-type flavoprotein [Actinomadura algeriensis]MBE1532649.1 PPOX class probable FMN-dependent enzyme [Actinomadura algeriensis]
MPNASPAPADAPADGYVEVRSPDVLREILGEPHPMVIDKVHDRLTPDDIGLLGRARLALLATSDARGELDVSPRGGDAGFVHVLDDRTLVLPERAGNRRGDTLHNILEHPNVGLLFLNPGDTYSLRLNGRARILQDASFFAEMTEKGAAPKLAILVEIDEVYLHCPASMRRAGLTAPAS